MTDLEKDIKHFEDRLARHQRYARKGVDNAETIAYEEMSLQQLKGDTNECKPKRRSC